MLWMWTIMQAHAHTGAVPLRGVYDWSNLPEAEPGAWIVWEFYPSIILGCLAWVALYAAMAVPLRRRFNLSDEGPSRGDWTRFVLSIAVVFWSLQGPLHELSDVYLFSGHMVQHLLITLVFPPLFLMGIPGWMWDLPLRSEALLRFGRTLTHPIAAFLISTAALYLWHIPSMYDWALEDHDVHIVEHLTFMTGYVIMWWPAFSRSERLPPLSVGYRMVYLFLLTIPMKALGAVITVSDYLLYEFYATQPRVFAMDPMYDQRLGGLIMWIPGGLVFWVTIGVIFFRSSFTLGRLGKTPAPEVTA